MSEENQNKIVGIRCLYCKGTGKERFPAWCVDAQGNSYSEVFPCDVCGGTGIRFI